MSEVGSGGGLPPAVRMHIVSDPAAIEGVRLACEKLAREAGFGEKAAWEIGLCVNEAIANVIEHAYAFATDQPIEVSAEVVPATGREGMGIRIRVRDWGPGVDPSRLPPKPKDPLVPGGLGLICMREMMDRVEYAPQPGGGMLLTLVRYLSERAG